MYRNIFILFVALLGFTACEDDFFSTTVVIDPPEPELRIATSATVSGKDSTVSIYIDRSVDIFENISYDDEGLENAKARLLADGNELGTFAFTADDPDPYFYSSGSNYSLKLDNRLETFGNNFEIVIEHADYQTTMASQTMPKAVLPTNLKFLANAGTDEYGDPTEGINLTIPDAAGEENFYEIQIFQVDSFNIGYGPEIYINRLYISSFDPNTASNDYGSSLLISDKGFDGQNYQMKVQLGNESTQTAKFVLLFSSITRDKYLYGTSINNYMSAADFGPFAEPVAIYSNFEDGFGTFGLANTQFVEILK